MARLETLENHVSLGRRIFKLVVTNLAILGVGVMTAELIFGGWVFGENFGAMPIPKSFSRRFDVDGLYGGGTSYFIRDEYGLRGEYSDPSKIDILTVGGSTTNELFVTEGKTWTDVLGQSFRDSGRNLVVVNAGVDGQSTIGHIKNFELWFPKIPNLKFRYIVFLLGVNDQGVSLSGRPYKSDFMVDRRRPLKRYLMNNSALYTLFRNVRGMVRARDAGLVHSTKNLTNSKWVPTAEPPDIQAAKLKYEGHLSDYGDRIKELVRLTHEWGAKPIFVTQHRGGYRIIDGTVYEPIGDDGNITSSRFTDLMAFNEKAMQTCREVREICIDLAKELYFGKGDHYDAIHTSPRGSKKIGEYLFHQLKDKIE